MHWTSSGTRCCRGFGARLPYPLRSTARSLLRRRWCRSSPENSASRNAITTSRANSPPIILAPRHRTFMSSCSTPWCAGVGVVAHAGAHAFNFVGCYTGPDPAAADHDAALGLAGSYGTGHCLGCSRGSRRCGQNSWAPKSRSSWPWAWSQGANSCLRGRPAWSAPMAMRTVSIPFWCGDREAPMQMITR